MRNFNIYFLLVFVGLAALFPLQAAKLPKNLDNLPVQYQGRMTPFSSFAREIILGVTSHALDG